MERLGATHMAHTSQAAASYFHQATNILLLALNEHAKVIRAKFTL
jgi:hypothetical protein